MMDAPIALGSAAVANAVVHTLISVTILQIMSQIKRQPGIEENFPVYFSSGSIMTWEKIGGGKIISPYFFLKTKYAIIKRVEV